ncbi:MAG: LamB/YcsF family protein, partial [Acidobacteria bacterium]|nr:LamB/YcsF family protein [Acidobacteriota bacterium]
GRLRPRSANGAVLTDADAVAAHVTRLLEGFVDTSTGPVAVAAETLCVHGDNPSALASLRRIRELVPRPA